MPANHNKPHTKSAKIKMSLSHQGVPNMHRRRPSKIVGGIEVFRCGRCFVYFPKNGFYKNKRTLLGITSECKKCHVRTVINSLDKEKRRLRAIKDQANRRAWQKGWKISTNDYKLLDSICGKACQKCGSKLNLQYDHVLPLSKTGLHHPSNIQILCRKCNEKKQASCFDYRTGEQIQRIKELWVIEFKKI